jgi:uncharacterized C2H2 Zn-finger protein
MPVSCPVCGDTFETDDQLAEHDHEMPIPWRDTGAGFECPGCGAMFDQQEDLVAHQAAGHQAASG